MGGNSSIRKEIRQKRPSELVQPLIKGFCWDAATTSGGEAGMFLGKRNAVGRSVAPCGVLPLETRQRNTERRKTRWFAEGRRVNYTKTSGPRHPAALCLSLVPQTDVLRASGGVRRKRGGSVSIYHIAHKSALPKRQTMAHTAPPPPHTPPLYLQM